ncbi:MAG: hypothetical protein M1834_003028 [Cirrosporium novae-zelandiae]|nr:MAG: hypothetical protein M1834_003028 [Cirrosporium novae-zelandiae]
MISLAPTWGSLIRFKDQNGLICFGEPDAEFKRARIWVGSSVERLLKTESVRNVAEVLSPYEPDNIICIGFNYFEAAKKDDAPEYPSVTHKSPNTINSPYAPIVIPKVCDAVECANELCVVLSKDAKDVSEDQALSYVLGYCVGNDVKSPDWLKPETSGGQTGFAKSFDSFFPFGPALVNVSKIPDPQQLELTTRVDGNVIQQGSTKDMAFTVAKLISFLSQGRTLPAGTLIATGSPPIIRNEKTQQLKAGHVVECEISGLGVLKNKLEKS